ncbi:MAG: hypothetical protein WC848_02580 [Parcubacteria group bacterium]
MAIGKNQSVEIVSVRFSKNRSEKFFWIFVDVPSQRGESPGHMAVVILRKEKVMIIIVFEYGKNGQYSVKRTTDVCGVPVLAVYCRGNTPPDMGGLYRSASAAIDVALYNLCEGEKLVLVDGADRVGFDVKFDQADVAVNFQRLRIFRSTVTGMAEAIAGLFHLRRELGWESGRPCRGGSWDT